jgi:hypothetical protein
VKRKKAFSNIELKIIDVREKEGKNIIITRDLNGLLQHEAGRITDRRA